MLSKHLSIAVLALAVIAGHTLANSQTSPADSLRARADSASLRFDFGAGRVAKGYKQVLATTLYTKETGYGFEPGSMVQCPDRGGRDAVRSDLCTSDKPFYFSVAVAACKYNVTVTFGDASAETTTTFKAELRRLMLERVQTRSGKFETRTFTVNIRTPQISTG